MRRARHALPDVQSVRSAEHVANRFPAYARAALTGARRCCAVAWDRKTATQIRPISQDRATTEARVPLPDVNRGAHWLRCIDRRQCCHLGWPRFGTPAHQQSREYQNKHQTEYYFRETTAHSVLYLKCTATPTAS